MSAKSSGYRFALIVTVLTLLLLALSACADGQSPMPADTSTPQVVEALAPIDSVEIQIAESWPPQYFLLVMSGLPNGCVEFDRYEVTREGNTIRVAIINLETTGNIACTEEYRTVENNIPLGSDFEPGTTYTVLVNDVSETFVTQAAAPGSGQVPATLDNPFQLKVGRTALIAPQGPLVEFVEVVEDSRCPTGVECVWEGRARILIRVSSSGDVLGFGVQELTLEAGRVDPAKDSLKGVYATYLFELVALDPYPKETRGDAQGEQPDYTATLLVSKLSAGSTPKVTSTAPCPTRPDWFVHTVVRGDTLFNIARRSGSSVEELATANCLDDATQIFVGQTLYVPKPVAPGDARP